MDNLKKFVITPAIEWLESQELVGSENNHSGMLTGFACRCEEGPDGFVEYECNWAIASTAASSRHYNSWIATALDDIMVSS